ncbi:hypothetical protein PPH41_33905, partial [Burkholderia gladioli]|nr:hypothetical protein [Burkholderia gladioli]
MADKEVNSQRGEDRGVRAVCVYCGSSPGADPAFMEASQALGRALARARLKLVYGGGDAQSSPMIRKMRQLGIKAAFVTGGTIVKLAFTNAKALDFSAVLTNLKGMNPDAVSYTHLRAHAVSYTHLR